MKTIQKIKKVRILRGYSQEFMSYQLNMSQSAYAKLERGIAKLTVQRLIEISKILDVGIQYLIDESWDTYLSTTRSIKVDSITLPSQSDSLENVFSSILKTIYDLKKENELLKNKIKQMHTL